MQAQYSQLPDIGTIDVVLSGAGISIPGPSGLPTGDALKPIVWQCICGFLSRVKPNNVILANALQQLSQPKQGAQDERMRLEELIELLTRRDCMRVLRRAYEFMGVAIPNSNHWYLAHLTGIRNFTVNMDMLLENAGCQDVIHLHGTWNDPDKIRTTTTDYFAPLSRDLRRLLGNAIAGKSVLVVGYSGRDVDVMPVFSASGSEPKRLIWVRHEQPGHTVDSLSHEAHTLLADLEKRGVEVFNSADASLCCDTNLLLRDVYLRQCRTAGRKPSLPPCPTQAELDLQVTTMQRGIECLIDDIARSLSSSCEPAVGLLAAAEVGFSTGLPDTSLALLDPNVFGSAHSINSPSTAEFEMARRRMQVRILRRMPGNPVTKDENGYQAWRILLKRPPRPLSRLALVENIDELASLAYHNGAPFIGGLVDTLIVASPLPRIIHDPIRRFRTVQRARLRRMSREEISGRPQKASKLASKVLPDIDQWPELARTIGISSAITALSDMTDMYRSQGNYQNAESCAAAFSEAALFADLANQAYSHYRQSELLLYSGRWRDSVNGNEICHLLDTHLDEAIELAERSGDSEPYWWTLALRTQWWHLNGQIEANPRKVIDQLSRLEPATKSSEHWIASYCLVLFAASNAYRHCLLAQILNAVHRARRAVQKQPSQAHYGHTLDMIEAYARWHATGKITWGDKLRLMFDEIDFRQRRMWQLAARCHVLLAAFTGKIISATTVNEYRIRGWLMEAEAAEHGTNLENLIWPE